MYQLANGSHNYIHINKRMILVQEDKMVAQTGKRNSYQVISLQQMNTVAALLLQ